MRKRLFYKMVYDVAKIDHGQILPRWAVFLHFIMFPLTTLFYAIKDRVDGYDFRTNTWRVHGVMVSDVFFYGMGIVGAKFQVVKNIHGVITLLRLE